MADGIYFREQNTLRALQYAQESVSGIQFNRTPIQVPFVIGAIIDLVNYLNLLETKLLELLAKSYSNFKQMADGVGKVLPQNKGNNCTLDCAVIRYIHQSNELEGTPAFDTIRSAFQEGEDAYPGATSARACVFRSA